MAKDPHEPSTMPGDMLVIEGHRVGEARRTGEILEVIGEPGRLHYRVRWDDGHESLYYPESGDATIRHAVAR